MEKTAPKVVIFQASRTRLKADINILLTKFDSFANHYTSSLYESVEKLDRKREETGQKDITFSEAKEYLKQLRDEI
jgi:hypothetical protein